MSIFKPAANSTAYLKAGFLGFAGSGKTYTAMRLAVGLAKLSAKEGETPKIAFFDTETGADYVTGFADKNGVQVDIARSRAFKDLYDGTQYAVQEGYHVMIVDSVSHVWAELLKAYMKKRNIKRMAVHHWGPVKDEWRQFTDLYLEAPMHVIVCGRAGYEWDLRETDDGGYEPMKVGTKMKAETEFGYEPSLLIEMMRHKKEGETGWIHRAVVLKDRTDQINGAEFDDPTFDMFVPVLNELNIGGTHHVLEVGRTSEDLFEATGESFMQQKKRGAIAIEEVAGLLNLHFPSTGKDDKIYKAGVKVAIYGTHSDTAIADLPVDTLEAAVSKAHYLVATINHDKPGANAALPDVLAKALAERDESKSLVEELQEESDNIDPDEDVTEELFTELGDEPEEEEDEAHPEPEEQATIKVVDVETGEVEKYTDPGYVEAVSAFDKACEEEGLDPDEALGIAAKAAGLKSVDELTADQINNATDNIETIMAVLTEDG